MTAPCVMAHTTIVIAGVVCNDQSGGAARACLDMIALKRQFGFCPR